MSLRTFKKSLSSEIFDKLESIESLLFESSVQQALQKLKEIKSDDPIEQNFISIFTAR